MTVCGNCTDNTEVILTKRKKHHVYQCQSCLRQVGTPIGEKKALLISTSFPEFKDKELDRFYFKDEEQLANWFVSTFERWFYIFTEVSGTHSSEIETLRVDYILYPKEELINNGFHPSYFGVEVKHFLPLQGHGRKPSRTLWQAVSYNDTFFDLKQSKAFPKGINRTVLPSKVKLQYTLLFSNLSFKHDYKEYFGLKRNFESNSDEQAWYGMLLLANHANVGVIDVDSENNLEKKSWLFSIGRSPYFSCRHGNKNSYKLHDINLVTKKRIGNF